MFKFNEQCNPRQISLTGVRAIVLLALLNVKPCTFEEIKKFFIDSNIVNREYSVDTIRIDLNTLKYIGCDISKATKKTNNTYILRSHPFQLKISDDEVTALTKVYKSIYKNLSLERLLEYNDLFNKLADSIDDETISEKLKGISILKGMNIELIKELLVDAAQQNRLTILYSPANSKTIEYDITIEKLAFRSDKLYIYCYNHSMKKRTFLNFKRMKEVLARSLRNEDICFEDTIVEFTLKNYANYELEENEKIIKEENDILTIKGSYYTSFIALQRMLFFGPDCKIISPDELKNTLIETVKSMRQQYD